jgi:hypothetical protein
MAEIRFLAGLGDAPTIAGLRVAIVAVDCERGHSALSSIFFSVPGFRPAA